MSTVTEQLTVNGMTCGHCVSSVEGALRPVEGVEAADVDLQAKTVTVVHDDRVTRDRLVELIEEQGYDVG